MNTACQMHAMDLTIEIGVDFDQGFFRSQCFGPA
jgi:hypothetical protein